MVTTVPVATTVPVTTPQLGSGYGYSLTGSADDPEDRVKIRTISCADPPTPDFSQQGSSLQFTIYAGGSSNIEYDLLFLSSSGAEWLYQTFSGGDVVSQQTYTGHYWVLRKKIDAACLEWFVFDAAEDTTTVSTSTTVPVATTADCTDPVANCIDAVLSIEVGEVLRAPEWHSNGGFSFQFNELSWPRPEFVSGDEAACGIISEANHFVQVSGEAPGTCLVRIHAREILSRDPYEFGLTETRYFQINVS